MRQYTTETKRRMIRLLRNAIVAIRTDTIKEPHHLGFVAGLLESIATDQSDDKERDQFQFNEGRLQPDENTEQYALLVEGWQPPVQLSAGLPT